MSLRCQCDKPIHDNATLCKGCTEHLGVRLGYLALLWPQLQLTITRQDALPAGQGHSDAMVAFNPAASEAAWAISNTLTTWARILHDTLGITLPPPMNGPICVECKHPSCRRLRLPTEVRLALLMAEHRHRIRLQDWAPEMHDEIDGAAQLAETTVDRPPDRQYLAKCEICDADLYAKPGAETTQCRLCFMVYDVKQRRGEVLSKAEDHIATATEIARALTSLGDPVTPERIRQWASRGRLASRGWIGKRPAYRIGDVRTLLKSERRAEVG